MTERLAIKDWNRDSSYTIGWFLPDVGDFGQMLGDGAESTSEGTDPDTKAACDAIRALPPEHAPEALNAHEWRWYSKSGAAAALRVAKAAVAAAKSNRPLPEWAQQALAAGWKAPKGWKP